MPLDRRRVDRDFVAACLEAFERLVSDFGFEPPEVEAIGHETYVRYHKGDRTVSVCAEAGKRPIVELFYPSAETGERPVPWAERNGVPRCRRFPRVDGDRLDAARSDGSQLAYLVASSEALMRTERSFLEGEDVAGPPD